MKSVIKLQQGQEIIENGKKSTWMGQSVAWAVVNEKGEILSVWQNKYSAKMEAEAEGERVL